MKFCPYDNCEGCDFDVVVVGWNDSTALAVSVSDSLGNVYQLAARPTVTGTVSQAIYYGIQIPLPAIPQPTPSATDYISGLPAESIHRPPMLETTPPS